MINLFKKVDSVIICNPSNLFYFSKYQNEDAVIILIEGRKYYLTDRRCLEETYEKLTDFIIVDINRNVIERIKEIIIENKCKSVGYEEDIPHNFYEKIVEAIKLPMFSVTQEISDIRKIKSAYELSLIMAAQNITDKTFSEVMPQIREGMTEEELGRLIEGAFYKNGADGISFYSIVAFGKNTSKPHAHRSGSKLSSGQLITMDFGASYHGYCSDMTRTVAFGNISGEEKRIYNIVMEAQELALEGMFTGITCKAAYNNANDCFKKYGLEKYFIHSLGHGLGVDTHEMPSLSFRSDEPLIENMVVSVEPGLYFDNKFGIRIEDIIYFKKCDIYNLTKSPKTLIIL